MPPVDPQYSFVDILPRLSSGAFLLRVVRHSVRWLFENVFYSPGRLYKSLQTMLDHWLGYRGGDRGAPKEIAYADLGALISVGEHKVRRLGLVPIFKNLTWRSTPSSPSA